MDKFFIQVGGLFFLAMDHLYFHKYFVKINHGVNPLINISFQRND